MLLTSVFYVSLSIKMGVYLYLYLHTNTDEEVYGKIWSRQFTRGLLDPTFMFHHIFFNQMCNYTDDLVFSFQLERHHHVSIHGNHHISMRVSMPASHPPPGP